MAALNVNERIAPALNLIADEILQWEERLSALRVAPLAVSHDSGERPAVVMSGREEAAPKTRLSPSLSI